MRTQHIEDKIIRRLREAGGIVVSRSGESALEITIEEGLPTQITLEIKNRLSTMDLPHLIDKLSREGHHVLAIPGLSPSRRDALRQANVSWIEYTTGLVHLRAPGLAIDLPTTNQKHVPRTSRILPSLSGKAGLIVEALIEAACSNPVVRQPQIAARTGSTQAWVSRVFRTLVEHDALMIIGSGPRKAWRVKGDVLIDIWVQAGGTKAESPVDLYLWTRHERHLLEQLLTLSEQTFPYAIGGVMAADLYEPTLTGRSHADIWMPASMPAQQLALALQAELVESGGNVTLWHASGDPALKLRSPLSDWRTLTDEPWGQLMVVSPARAIAEASSAGGRGPEVASRLQEALSSKIGRATVAE